MKKRFAYSALVALALLAPAYSQTTAKPVVSGMATAGDFGGYAGAAAPGSCVEIHGSNLAGTSEAGPQATSRDRLLLLRSTE